MSKENTTKKLIRSKSGLRIVVVDENYKSPFLLSEPRWIPDKVAPLCTSCGIKFNFTTRRHHCRRCGQVYCGACCEHKLELPRMCFVDPVRVCGNCTAISLQEIKFFDQQIKTLINGATFLLEDAKTIVTSSDSLHCRLSSDHRQLLFEGVKLAPLDISNIKVLRVETNDINGMKSVEMEFCDDSTGEKQAVKLSTSSDEEHRKTGTLWIAAIQQAVKMLEDYN